MATGEQSFETALDQAQNIITQLPYFTKEFNTAIIDGPVRIYFSELHEGEALQIYFEIQETFSNSNRKLDSISKSEPFTYVMIYPDRRLLNSKFPENPDSEKWRNGKFDAHHVFGMDVDDLMAGGAPYRAALSLEIFKNYQDTVTSLDA